MESNEIVFVGLGISLICLFGIVSALFGVPKAATKKALKTLKGKDKI